jgi:hypothetical protein
MIRNRTNRRKALGFNLYIVSRTVLPRISATHFGDFAISVTVHSITHFGDSALN